MKFRDRAHPNNKERSTGSRPAAGAFVSGHGVRHTSAGFHMSERVDPVGSKNRWPRCNARTRSGAPCRAAAAGFGRRGHPRCVNHGGLSGASGDARDRLVFFGGASFDPMPRWRRFGKVPRRPWSVSVVPSWLADQLPEYALLDGGICEQTLRARSYSWRTGRVARGADLARRWPQVIGFRPALLLLERGRVAFGVFAYDRDITQWTRRRHPFEESAEMFVRLGADEMLGAMRASGGSLRKRLDPRIPKEMNDEIRERKTKPI